MGVFWGQKGGELAPYFLRINSALTPIDVWRVYQFSRL